MSVAIVLGGAGTRGDFQIGAVRFLADRGIQPNIVTGASGGAVVSAKLAEGSSGLDDLETTWLSLVNDAELYTWEQWLLDLQREVRESLRLVSEKLERFVFFPPLVVVDLIGFGLDIHQIEDAAERGLKAKSLLSFSPLAARLRNTGSGRLDTQKVRNSGIKLRISVVSLEDAKLRYATELGELINESDRSVAASQIDLVDAVIASAAIPVVVAPVKLDGQNYVDGGVRELVPVKVAVDLGADDVFIIYPVPGAVFDPDNPTYDSANLATIGSRSIDIGLDEIRRNDVNPRGEWGNVAVTTIQGSFEVHGSLTIDPGLIRISIGYGYMRASDIIDGSPRGEQRVNELKGLSDQITRLRMECWDLEYRANGVDKPPELTLAGPRPRETVPLPDPTSIREVRRKKREIRELVQRRLNLNGAVPNGVEEWWREWERHPWPTYTATPWDEFSSRAGYVPAEPAPANVVGKAPVPIASIAPLLLEDKAPVPVASIALLLLGD